MTYLKVYNNKLKEIKELTLNMIVQTEKFVNSIDVNSFNDLSEFKNIFMKLDKHKIDLNSVKVNFKVEQLKTIIESDYAIKIQNSKNKKNKLMEESSREIQNVIDLKVNKIKEINNEIRKRNNSLKEEIEKENSKYREVEELRQTLLTYSDYILNVCYNYGIKVSDISINTNMFSLEELYTFYSQFNQFMKNKSNKLNPIRFILSKTDDTFVLLFLLCLFIFVLCTSIFNVLSIFIILYILYVQSMQDSLVKKFTIMAGLAFNVKPMEMGLIKELSEDDLEQEIPEEIDVDLDDELQDMYSSMIKKVEELDEEDSLVNQMNNELADFVSKLDLLNDGIQVIINDFNKKKQNTLLLIDNKINELNRRSDFLKSNIKLFGYDFSHEYFFNTNFKLGFNDETYKFESMDFGFKNVIINQNMNSESEIDEFLKVLVVNYLCNIRPGYIDITIYDPNGLGRSLAGFYEDSIDNIIHIIHSDLDKTIKELNEYNDMVIRKGKGLTLDEYNRESSKQGRTCIPYKLLIVMSQPKSLEENEALSKFMEFSPDLGVFIVMVSNRTFSNTLTFNKVFENINNKLSINPSEFIYRFIKELNSLKSESLMWNEFKDIAIPDDRIWSWNADERIELDPGFEDGDPSKFKGYSVGNTGDIHSIIVGGTGAGKSVFINNIIANVCSKYSPASVELTLVDFKGSEFQFYLKDENLGRSYMLPHISDCLCTSDPDYSVSLFNKLRTEADDRYNKLKELGFKNMYELNTSYRKSGKPELCWTRKLIIVDEFQVIFEKTDGKAQDKLKKDITQIAKVARACGIHLMFCSQSMKGTISDDILSQFTLRFGLRCPMEVSMAIMGTKFSGDIREKNGYLYVSSIDDKKKELQKRYRTPFIPDDQLRGRIDLLAKMSIDKNIVRKNLPVTYDENTIHYIEELDGLYSEIESNNISIKSLFILGERMVYSSKGRRSNIILERENNQHIFSIFMNNNDAVMFFKTIMKNIELNGGGKVIINSKNKDLSYISCADEFITKDLSILYDAPLEDILGLINSIKDKRELVDDKDTLEPIYVILFGWDKAMGFGVDTKFKLTDKFSILMQTSGSCHIHFIYICSSLGEIPKNIPNACLHRIAGKCDEKSSNTLLDSDAAYKTYSKESGYMFLYSYGNLERLKIYQSEVTRNIKSRSIII